MTEAERLVIETLRDLRLSPFSPVSTRLLADFVGYSPRWVREHLTNLRRNGLVTLPRGRCSGWVETHPEQVYTEHYAEILDKISSSSDGKPGSVHIGCNS